MKSKLADEKSKNKIVSALKAENKEIRHQNQGLLSEVKQKNAKIQNLKSRNNSEHESTVRALQLEIKKLKKTVDDKNDQVYEKVGWAIIKLFGSSSSDLLETSRGHHELNSL